MWKQTTLIKKTYKQTERIINNRYFTELLIRAAMTGRTIQHVSSSPDDGLSNEILIEDESAIITFKYLKGWAERPTTISGIEYHE